MPIVFLHGLGQKPGDWDPVINRLDKGSRALCPDLYALEREGEDYPALYGALERYCDGLEGPLDLCGLSLGGVLALQYAAEHPETAWPSSAPGPPCPRACWPSRTCCSG